ncbi:glycosyl transferase family 1 [filamentous cyanobacterium CCP5]|nr:glycosyl transferase family 1 [filamentous cyanobacterium CCT1]PSN20342.1 glycosyl transferase family 1 [filamentous cyanobacterium CCP5]
MMKVVFEATSVKDKPSGVGHYVLNMLDALYALQQPESFYLSGVSYYPGLRDWLLGNWAVPSLLHKYSRVLFLPLPVRILGILSKIPNNPILEKLESKFDSPDIYHGTNFAVYPCRHSKRVMNIYDLSFIRHPNYVTSVVRTYNHRVRQCIQWTDLVITNAESSKQEIVEYLGVSPDHIRVTPLASRYSGISLDIDKLKRPSQLGESPYILLVSTLEPRKNVLTLIQAFEQLKSTQKIEHQLILIGQKGWQFEPILKAIEESPWKSHIHHLGYLSDHEVAASYVYADVFAYPSFYEGFGLPVLEAMALGCPVVTSNQSSLPEVAGDAALLVNPSDAEELADGLYRVISDRSLRQTLIDRGKARAATYSWQRTAQETLAAYRSIL